MLEYLKGNQTGGSVQCTLAVIRRATPAALQVVNTLGSKRRLSCHDAAAEPPAKKPAPAASAASGATTGVTVAMVCRTAKQPRRATSHILMHLILVARAFRLCHLDQEAQLDSNVHFAIGLRGLGCGGGGDRVDAGALLGTQAGLQEEGRPQGQGGGHGGAHATAARRWPPPAEPHPIVSSAGQAHTSQPHLCQLYQWGDVCPKLSSFGSPDAKSAWLVMLLRQISPYKPAVDALHTAAGKSRTWRRS